MSIYEVLKRVIRRGDYDAADIKRKMSLYLQFNCMTEVEYVEVMGLMAV